MARLVIVGAGMAGLTAARLLAADNDVVVIDKGRGVGGRMATRRIGDATFDHGAQFITGHDESFAATLAAWDGAGLVETWFSDQVGPGGVDGGGGHPRYRGVPTMNSLAKHLADGLEVRRRARVAAVEQRASGWTVLLEGQASLDADALVLTAPVPQSLAVLEAGDVRLSPADRGALGSIAYDPCLATLVPLEGPSSLPEPGAVRPVDGPIEWMADNQRKGASALPAITIHATAAFSREMWDLDDHRIIEDLVRAAGLEAVAVPGASQVQRWRYARPTVVHPDPCLVAGGLPPLVFAGDAFGGPKVEGAARSGAAADAAMRTRLAGA